MRHFSFIANFMPLTGVEPVTPCLAAASFPKGALPLWRSPPQNLAGHCHPDYVGRICIFPTPLLVLLQPLLFFIYMPLTGVEPVPLAPEANALSIALQGRNLFLEQI